MDMDYFDWLLSKLSELNTTLQASESAKSSSRLASEYVRLPHPEKISDYVYEAYKPAGTPSVEIIFFHGLQPENSTAAAHITTWVSRDKSELWLNWLPERFPDARILTISYDAFAGKTSDEDTKQMHVDSKNVANILTGSGADVGQNGSCPVVLVGHSLGGLVMKELCVQLNSILMMSLKEQGKSDERVQNLLSNIKGLFFYASPHHGSRLADRHSGVPNGPLFEDASTLSEDAAQRNEEFWKVRLKYGWKASGVGENRQVTLGNFTGFVVAEASARHDVDIFHTIDDADHFNICQPHSRESNNYRLLSDFVAGVMNIEGKMRYSTSYDLPPEVKYSDYRDVRTKIVEEKLRGAPRLGIVGLGGIGKTTLARTVYYNISQNFEYHCFFDEVKMCMGEEVEPADLRAEIMKRFFSSGLSMPEHWDGLRGKSVLIVLDDVESVSQMSVMTESDGFSEESRIIVTCRNGDFLIPLGFELHYATQLGLDEAKELFCRLAFKETTAPHAYEERVARFAEQCGGHPLALKVAGSYLYKQEEGMWDDAFEKLTHAQSLGGDVQDRLRSILRLSYESLPKQEKEMFLDVASCFHGENLRSVKEAWKSCSWASPDSGWENLVDRSLVSTADYEQIWIHEELHDLGQSKECLDPKNVAGQSRVFNIEQANQLLYQEEVEVKVLKIINLHGPGPSLNINVLSGLKKLEILWLQGVWLLDHGLHTFLPKFPAILVGKLHPNALEGEGDSSFRVTLPIAFSDHPALRYLVIKDCASLQALPNTFGGLSTLQHMVIQDCPYLQVLPGTFGDHLELRNLEIGGCNALQTIPSTFGSLSTLQNLELRECGSLQALPDTFGYLPALQKLKILTCASLQALPNTFGSLRALQHLEIRQCCSLQALPDTFGSLIALENLVIQECNSLQVLPNTFGGLLALQYLEILTCATLQSLPETFGGLSALQDLNLSECPSLQALPDTFGGLAALSRLYLRHCKSLQALPDTIGRLPISFLDITHCSSLHNRPDTFECLLGPAVLFISDCPLQALPNTFGGLRALRQLYISECAALQALPDTFGDLRALQYLYISECAALQALPDTFGGLRALRHLHISGCAALQALPDTFGDLRALQYLFITECAALQALPDTFGGLRALRHLHISECAALQVLPDTFGDLSALNRLDIWDCAALQALPNNFQSLLALQHLAIQGCGALQVLPNSLGSLPALQYLTIQGCAALQVLPNSFRSLPALKHLDVQECSSLQAN